MIKYFMIILSLMEEIFTKTLPSRRVQSRKFPWALTGDIVLAYLRSRSDPENMLKLQFYSVVTITVITDVLLYRTKVEPI